MPILTDSALKISLPKMTKVMQTFDRIKIENIEEIIIQELRKEEIYKRVYPGQKIALAIGSRGIYQLDVIVKTLVNFLKDKGAKPFIVPSMGSHGGATAPGQLKVLESYGISEIKMGVPIISSMEVIEIGKTVDGIPVYFDKVAYENADMVIPVARIKPHTDFKGEIESGICKMMAIGLGKHIGCSRLHQEGFDTFAKLIPEVAKIIIEKTKIGFGLGIIENAYDKTMTIQAIPSDKIIDEEKKLLTIAKRQMPSIMVPEIDVLIVEEIGKDISGAGMDPNIIGRTTKGKLDGFNGPKIQRIVVLGLSDATQGNACGIGLADFTTRKVADQINQVSTYANVIASANPEAGRIPISLDNEREAIIAAIKCCSRIDENNPKIVRIKNTLDLEIIEVSQNILTDLVNNERIRIIE